MKTLWLVILSVLIIGCGDKANEAAQKSVGGSGVTVSVSSSASRPDYPVSNLLDSNYNTFMTTYALNMGQTIDVNFEFITATNIVTMDVYEDYQNQYLMGDLTVMVSSDSTNGTNGSWTTVTTMNASNHGFTNGDGTININQNNVKFLKLRMFYSGTGAHGTPPSVSFYLSEVNFH